MSIFPSKACFFSDLALNKVFNVNFFKNVGHMQSSAMVSFANLNEMNGSHGRTQYCFYIAAIHFRGYIIIILIK